MSWPVRGNFERKVKTIPELIKIAEQCRSVGRVIVYCHGVFDIMHVAHVHHLEQAKREGDVLIVTLTTDEFVSRGTGRPIFDQNLRLIMMASLEIVDFVAVNKAPNSVELIKLLRPHVYVKGEDSKANPTEGLKMEMKAIEEVGGRTIFTKSLPIHSTHIIEEEEPVSFWKIH